MHSLWRAAIGLAPFAGVLVGLIIGSIVGIAITDAIVHPFGAVLGVAIAVGITLLSHWLANKFVHKHIDRSVQRVLAEAGLICIQCGYDLTGNVSGVCPECGTAIAEPRNESE